MNLRSRVERLELKSNVGTIAARLGGMAVVTELPNGHYEIRDRRVLTDDELHEMLAGCTGRLLVLDI